MSRRPLAWLLALLPAAAGCGHFGQIQPEGCELRLVEQIPDESKNCIHVFLIDSFDPFAASSLADVRAHLHHLGFPKVYHGYAKHAGDMMVEMGTVAVERPGARFAVIGLGSGCDAARGLAAFGATVGAPVDVAIYLEPGAGAAWVEPDSAISSFSIRADDLGAGPDPVKKSAVAAHPEALAVIERELALIGMTIPPPVRKVPPRVYLVEPIPPPRETTPRPRPLPPDWWFLRPRHPWDAPLPRQPADVETLPMPRVVPELPPPTPGP